MAAISGTIAAIAAGVGAAAAAYGAYQGHEARKDAKAANAKSAAEQRKIQSEQRALQAQQQAQERRQQIREERVRRARILQSATNTGTSGSSGEAGALGSMATQLGTNIGINMGRAQAGERISTFMQNAADFNLQSQNAMFGAQNADAMFGMGMSIFSAAGGTSALRGASAPSTSGAGPSGREFDFSTNMQQYGV